jgi:hypothetical protein
MQISHLPLAQTNVLAQRDLSFLPPDYRPLFEKADEFLETLVNSTNRTATAVYHLPATLQRVLKDADEFILFSLDPTPDSEHKATNTFKRYPVIGQTEIKAYSTRRQLTEELDNAIRAEGGLTVSNGVISLSGPFAHCFNPRHGIRARKSREKVDLLICFECGQVQIGSNSETERVLKLTKKPSKIFDAVLTSQGVPLPKK